MGRVSKGRKLSAARGGPSVEEERDSWVRWATISAGIGSRLPTKSETTDLSGERGKSKGHTVNNGVSDSWEQNAPPHNLGYAILIMVVYVWPFYGRRGYRSHLGGSTY